MIDIVRPSSILTDTKRSHYLVILWCCVYALAWTTVSFYLDPTVPYDAIEALNWASNGEWGSPKNPWFVGLISSIFLYSNTPEMSSAYWYFVHFIVISIGMLGCYRLTYKLSNSIHLSWLGLLTLNFSGIINIDAIPYNDNYLLFGTWPWLLLIFIKAIWESPRWWLLFGFVASCSAMAKYTTFAPIMMIFILSLTVKSVRQSWREAYYYIGVFIFIALVAPNIFWMVNNNFSAVRWVDSQVTAQLSPSSWLSFLSVFYPLIFLVWFVGNKNIKLPEIISEKTKLLMVVLFVPLAIIMAWFSFHKGGRLVEWLHPFFMPAPAILVTLISPCKLGSLSRVYKAMVIIPLIILGGYATVLLMNIKNAGNHLSGVKVLSEEAKTFWYENSAMPLTFVGGDDISQWLTFYIAPHPKVTRKWSNDSLPNIYNRHISAEQISQRGVLLVGKVGAGCQNGAFTEFTDEWTAFKPTIEKEIYYQRSPREVKNRICLGIVSPAHTDT